MGHVRSGTVPRSLFPVPFLRNRPPFGWVEGFARLGHFDEDLGGLESWRESGVQLLQLSNDGRGADRVHVSERPAAEWGEADAEDSPDVAIAHRAQNTLLEAAGCFVDHREHAATDHLLLGDGNVLSGA